MQGSGRASGGHRLLQMCLNLPGEGKAQHRAWKGHGEGAEDGQCGLRGQADSVGGPWRVLSRGCCDGFAFGKPALWLPGGDGWEGTREVQGHAWCLTGEEGMEESGGGQSQSCKSARRGVQAIQMGATQDPRGVCEVNERMWVSG